MEPSFFRNEYLVVDMLSYVVTSPKRGDVIVFRHPEPRCRDHVESNYINRKFIQGPCTNYIKRIVGLPGETVKIREGRVMINEQVLNEEYITRNIPTLGNQTVILGDDEFFVLGDNRNPNASSDSREWGVLPRAHITGRAILVLLPPERINIVERIEY